MVVFTKEEGVTYSDHVGRYPINSSQANPYILVFYDYYRKYILTGALPSRSGTYIYKCFQNSGTRSRLMFTIPLSISWTMNLVISSRRPFSRKRYLTSLFPHIFIAKMPLKYPSKLSKTISMLTSAQLNQNTLPKNGASFSHMRPQSSICCVHPVPTQKYQPMPPYLSYMISTISLYTHLLIN